MFKSLLILSLILLSFSQIAWSQVATFTDEEVQVHRANIDEIAATAADCLDWVYQDHLEFFNKWGVSKYYGNRRSDYSTKAGLMAALAFYKKPKELVYELEPISCIGLTLRCLREGFAAVGTEATFEKINDELKKGNNFFGTDLQKNLILLGWKSYYWNPAPWQNADWDEEDRTLNKLKEGKKWMPVWGGHAERYRQATEKGFYYERGLTVDDAVSLVGFNETQPAFFKGIPFFVGIAHAGYHVFSGRAGEVIEAHSMRDLNSINNLEYSEFNPLKTGGGPRWTPKERYRSGLIVTPQ